MSSWVSWSAAPAVLFAWAGWSSLVHADDLPPFPKYAINKTEAPPGAPPIDNTPSKRPVRDWFQNRRPLGCWASFNGYSCSSLRSEAAFIFGSCRTFFGEPCLKGPPPSPLPPWAGLNQPGASLPDGAPGTSGVGPAAPPRCACP